jgi:hypothetical protein
MSFSDVSTMLWRERDALEMLLFKLTEEQLIAATANAKWLNAATREVEAALDELRGTEILRAAEVDALAASLGWSSGLTLAALAEHADQPWSELLLDHRGALIALVHQIEAACEQNRQVLAAGARSVRETLLALGNGVETYDASGHSAPGVARPRLMDEQL